MQRPDPRSATNTNPSAEAGILARIALALTDWTERWVPAAYQAAGGATRLRQEADRMDAEKVVEWLLADSK